MPFTVTCSPSRRFDTDAGDTMAPYWLVLDKLQVLTAARWCCGVLATPLGPRKVAQGQRHTQAGTKPISLTLHISLLEARDLALGQGSPPVCTEAHSPRPQPLLPSPSPFTETLSDNFRPRTRPPSAPFSSPTEPFWGKRAPLARTARGQMDRVFSRPRPVSRG